MKTGKTVKTVIEEVVFERKKVTIMDVDKWPNNTPCAY